MKTFFKWLAPFFGVGGVTIAFCCVNEYLFGGARYDHVSIFMLDFIDRWVGWALFLAALLTAAFFIAYLCQMRETAFGRPDDKGVMVLILGGYEGTMMGAALLGPPMIGLGMGVSSLLTFLKNLIFILR